VIKSFGSRATEAVYHDGRHRKIPNQLWEKAADKLDLLDAAKTLVDLRVPPGNRLERLKGDLSGYHSIRINEQWRIIFRWEDGDAYEVKIVDYH
jgi:toxin HigB-1